jgi:2-methylcitrate dehydratase PrpD
VTDGLAEQFNITRITQKNHGCCGHTFAAIDALLETQNAHGFTAGEIRRITVHTYAAALDVAGIRDPKSAFEARFSLPYVMSHAAVHGSVRLAAFEPERLRDEKVRALLGKVELVADPELTAAFPKQRAARVEVTLADGRTVSAFAPYRRGDPEAPLSDAELNGKFIELASPVIGDAAAITLLDQLWHVDEVAAVADLKLSGLRPLA